MVLPTIPSPISFNNLKTEFNGTNPVSIDQYYEGGSLVPAGVGVTTSGQISLSNFSGKSKPTYVASGLKCYIDFGKTASFNDTGLTIYDISGNNNNFTINKAKTSGWSYSAANGYIYTPFSANINAVGPNNSAFGINSDVTIEFVVKADTMSASSSILYMPDSSSTRMVNIHVPWPQDGNVYFDFKTGASLTNRVNYPATTTSLSHYVFKANSTSSFYMQIIQDNVSRATRTTPMSLTGTWNGSTNLFNDGATNAWGGYFYYMRIYNRALTTAEINQNYAEARSRFPSLPNNTFA